ncbi:MAG TPA: hypothetical protein VHQ65_11055 [Thermoanaerobaculia bacterium]|nr:hypothetical protein [Thermoanaerobaculia bacterium]
MAWHGMVLAGLLPIMTTAVSAAPLRLAAGPGDSDTALLAGHALRLAGEADEPLVTLGSDDSLARLARGHADAALIQADRWAAWQRVHGAVAETLQDHGVLYLRYLHVLVRPGVELEGLHDLDGLTIWRDTPGRDSDQAVCAILGRCGVDPTRLREPSCGDLARCFERDQADLALVFRRAGDPELRRLIEGPARLARWEPLRPVTLRRLRGRAPLAGFRHAELPGGATVAVPVLLVARRQLAAERLDVLHTQLVRAARAFPPPGSATGGAAADGGRRDGAWESAPWWQEAVPWAVSAGLGLLVLICGLLFRSRRVRPWQRGRIATGGCLLLIVCALVITAGTFAVERRYNEHFTSFEEAFWSILVYVTSGLENRPPLTPEGRILTFLGLLVGVVGGSFSGALFTSLLVWPPKRPFRLSKHYLVLNWNERGSEILTDLHHPDVAARFRNATVVILTGDRPTLEDLEHKVTSDDGRFRRVYPELGDPSDARCLRRVRAQHAATVVVLAPTGHGDGVDLQTLRTIRTLRRLAEEAGRRDLHVVAELLDRDSQSLFDDLAADFPGLLETVSSGHVRGRLLAQAALRSGIIDFFKDLLEIGDESNELYVLPIPPAVAGTSFTDYAARMIARQGTQPMIPVGVRRRCQGREVMFCNPRPGTPAHTLEVGDELVVITYDEPKQEDLPPAGPTAIR